MKKTNEVWGPLLAGEEYDKQTLREYYAALCRDIAQQRRRVGGDWAVAHVVFSREMLLALCCSRWRLKLRLRNSRIDPLWKLLAN